MVCGLLSGSGALGSMVSARLWVLGNSSQVVASKSRPVRFLLVPPHCLKKNGVFCAMHWSRMSRTHSMSIGLDLGPDSPPVITQSGLYAF